MNIDKGILSILIAVTNRSHTNLESSFRCQQKNLTLLGRIAQIWMTLRVVDFTIRTSHSADF